MQRRVPESSLKAFHKMLKRRSSKPSLTRKFIFNVELKVEEFVQGVTVKVDGVSTPINDNEIVEGIGYGVFDLFEDFDSVEMEKIIRAHFNKRAENEAKIERKKIMEADKKKQDDKKKCDEEEEEEEDEEYDNDMQEEEYEVPIPTHDVDDVIAPIIPFRKKKNCYNQKEVIEAIFTLFAKGRPNFRKLGSQYRIPRTTITGWYKQHKIDKTWRPTSLMYENRRIFTNKQEAIIKEKLETKYIKEELPLSYETIKSEILDFIGTDIEPLSDGVVAASSHKLDFKCSNQFIKCFLRRNGLSNRVCTAERRPKIDENEVSSFNELMQKAFADTSDKIILNADESQWRVLMPPRRTVAKKGQDSVRLNIDGDNKAGFTIVGTISSDGDRLPLVMIAKGRSPVCHKQLGKHPAHNFKILHSISGWMSEEAFIEYLLWIKIKYGLKKIYLVVDQYGTHFCPKARTKAEELNISLIPIPKGGTSKYQPLDRGIFGIMKSKGRAKWAEISRKNPTMKWDKQTSAGIALKCWEEITKTHILKAWDLQSQEEDSESTEYETDSDFRPIIIERN